MVWLFALGAAIVGYLLGSIPVGLWVCQLYGVDIRTVGSGRTGGTNAWRAAGLKAAIPTVLGDALKGVIAIALVGLAFRTFFPEPATMSVPEAIARTTALHLAESLAGALAIVGHNWSLFNNFKGGAGGITAAATTMALYPPVGGIVWLTGILMFWWGRIASIATYSVGVSAMAVFVMSTVEDWQTFWPYSIYGIIAFISIMVALRPNREKLKQGEERVVTLW